MNKLSNYTKRLEDFQNTLIANKNDSTVFGDGKKLVNNDVFKIIAKNVFKVWFIFCLAAQQRFWHSYPPF